MSYYTLVASKSLNPKSLLQLQIKLPIQAHGCMNQLCLWNGILLSIQMTIWKPNGTLNYTFEL
jgi:hypothetical protein